MIAIALMTTSAGILLLLGTLHLFYTFSGPMLRPRDPELQTQMAKTFPGITKDATMWSFWIGFNVSHSMAAMLFGLIYGFLAIAHASLLFSSAYLLVIGFVMLGGLLAVAKVYWFKGPLVGVGISLTCYVASIIVALA